MIRDNPRVTVTEKDGIRTITYQYDQKVWNDMVQAAKEFKGPFTLKGEEQGK